MGFASPTAVAASTEQRLLKMLALANEEGQELAARHDWQVLTKEATFTTVAVESQGAVSSIINTATSGDVMDHIVNNTIWNRDLRRPVFGPLDNQQWQQLKALNINGPWNQFRIRGGNIIFIPVPAAGNTCAFEYTSKMWATDSTGATLKSAFTVDTDVSLLDDRLITLGLVWRYKQSNGLEYAEDFNKYEIAVTDAMGKDGVRDWLNLSGSRYDVAPGILVPLGNWGV